MPQSPPAHLPQRAALLAQQFVRDYEEAILNHPLPLQREITEYLLNVLNLIEAFAQTGEDSVYQQFVTLSDGMLKKYGSLLQAYWNKKFHVYFHFDNLLAEKAVITSEVFNGLTSAQQRLSVEEIGTFIKIGRSTLSNGLHFLYLRPEPETTTQPNTGSLSAPQEVAEETDEEVTQARQLLTIYYFLKAAFAVEHRTTHTVSDIVRLIHLLTGTKFTSLQNSAMYKKYLLMPNYKQGEPLIKDLQYIRSYFEQTGLAGAVKEIDTEMSRCIEELPLALRKKWQRQ